MLLLSAVGVFAYVAICVAWLVLVWGRLFGVCLLVCVDVVLFEFVALCCLWSGFGLWLSLFLFVCWHVFAMLGGWLLVCVVCSL